MSLHADVYVPARDRRRLERLCRYVARPPLALDRLEAPHDGRLAYRLKTPWRDGTTHVVMKKEELLERLAPLIPPPRSHQVRYHGVLAPCASGRDRIVPGAKGQVAEGEEVGIRVGEFVRSASDIANVGRSETSAGSAETPGGAQRIEIDPQPKEEPSRPLEEATPSVSELASRIIQKSRRMVWADLLQRVFEVDALCCPRCGGRMRVLSAITDPEVARRILDCVGMSSRGPPLAPARQTSQENLEDERIELSWDEDPGFDFDQSDLRDG